MGLFNMRPKHKGRTMTLFKKNIEEELEIALLHLKEFETKRKKLRSHKLSIRYCDKIIPFLRGRISGLSFVKEKKYK